MKKIAFKLRGPCSRFPQLLSRRQHAVEPSAQSPTDNHSHNNPTTQTTPNEPNLQQSKPNRNPFRTQLTISQTGLYRSWSPRAWHRSLSRSTCGSSICNTIGKPTSICNLDIVHQISSSSCLRSCERQQVAQLSEEAPAVRHL